MKTSTSDGKHGIQYKAYVRLDELNFTDDLTLPSHTHQQIKVKTISVVEGPVTVGFNIHEGKTKVLKHNTENTNPFILDGETL
ncbi:unnamed protein product [Schistosoma margrebowiei]|uniref:Uncharacterized protein n=1 Tax=Schistosoma margrebowiei TaxID=48269 RepID=A0A183MR01_9TREM|nr:unnamed protein product [Schistosoma margrebowiei]